MISIKIIDYRNVLLFNHSFIGISIICSLLSIIIFSQLKEVKTFTKAVENLLGELPKLLAPLTFYMLLIVLFTYFSSYLYLKISNAR